MPMPEPKSMTVQSCLTYFRISDKRKLLYLRALTIISRLSVYLAIIRIWRSLLNTERPTAAKQHHYGNVRTAKKKTICRAQSCLLDSRSPANTFHIGASADGPTNLILSRSPPASRQ